MKRATFHPTNGEHIANREVNRPPCRDSTGHAFCSTIPKPLSTQGLFVFLGGIMREWCSCGSAIRARRADVLTWRREHRCPDRPDDPAEHISAGSSFQLADEYASAHPNVQARIGFQAE